MAEKDPLDRYFDAARARPEPASEAFLARIAADADAAVPVPHPARQRSVPRWRGVLSALGDWPGAAGLATAAAAGLWIGIAQPLDFDPLALVAADDAGWVELSMGYGALEWGLE